MDSAQFRNPSGYRWYDDNKAKYKNTYGALYNWYAVKSGKLCPTGWHVSSNEEWDIMISYLGGEDVAGGKLKKTDSKYWKIPNLGQQIIQAFRPFLVAIRMHFITSMVLVKWVFGGVLQSPLEELISFRLLGTEKYLTMKST